MSPEDELCLLLARARLSPEARERAQSLLAGPLQWPRVFERARRYGVFPLLYAALRALGFPGVPDPVRSEWTTIFGFNAIQNELLAGELARILRLLGDAGIPVMPLKGIALGESLYGDPALRVLSDIDVLVPAKNVAEAFHLLLSSGYEGEFTQPRLLDLVVRYGKHCILTRQDRMRAYTLELHSGLLWGGQLERELLGEVWSEAGRRSFYGVPAFALSAEWEFLYLAVHAAQHGWLSLRWYADLDRLCCRGTIDWKKVNEKATWLGWQWAVRSSLAACAVSFRYAPRPRLCLDTAPAPVACSASLRSPGTLGKPLLASLAQNASPKAPLSRYSPPGADAGRMQASSSSRLTVFPLLRLAAFARRLQFCKVVRSSRLDEAVAHPWQLGAKACKDHTTETTKVTERR